MSGQQQSEQASTCLTAFESIFGFTRSDIDRESGTFEAMFLHDFADIPAENFQSIGFRVREGVKYAQMRDGSISVDWDAKPVDAQNNIYHKVLVHDPTDPGRENNNLDGDGGTTIAFGRYPDSPNSRGAYNVRTHDGDSIVYKVIVETCGLYEEQPRLFYPLWCDVPNGDFPNPNPIDPKPRCVMYDEWFPPQ